MYRQDSTIVVLIRGDLGKVIRVAASDSKSYWEIADFTGISAPYEAPENPEMRIDTVAGSIDECATRIVDYIISEFSGS